MVRQGQHHDDSDRDTEHERPSPPGPRRGCLAGGVRDIATRLWEVVCETVRDRLVQPDRSLQVLEPLLSEVTKEDVQVLFLVLDERMRCLRYQDLATRPPPPRSGPRGARRGPSGTHCPRRSPRRCAAPSALGAPASRPATPGRPASAEPGAAACHCLARLVGKATKNESPWVSTCGPPHSAKAARSTPTMVVECGAVGPPVLAQQPGAEPPTMSVNRNVTVPLGTSTMTTSLTRP